MSDDDQKPEAVDLLTIAKIAYTAARGLEGESKSPPFNCLKKSQLEAVLLQVNFIRDECRVGPRELLRRRMEECAAEGVCYGVREAQRDLLFAKSNHTRLGQVP